MKVKFEWDDKKNIANKLRHGVSFEEASELFNSGRDYLELFDAAHSALEDRFLAIGMIARGLVLVVWTERDEDIVRIIGARWAARQEQRMYVEYMERRND